MIQQPSQSIGAPPKDYHASTEIQNWIVFQAQSRRQNNRTSALYIEDCSLQALAEYHEETDASSDIRL